MMGSTIQSTNQASAAVENGTTSAIEEPDGIVGYVLALVMLLLVVLVLVGGVGWWVYIIWHT